MASRLPLKSCTKMNLLTPHPSLILWLAPQSEETLVLEVSIFASPEEGPGVWASAFPRSKPTEASEVEICGVDALGQEAVLRPWKVWWGRSVPSGQGHREKLSKTGEGCSQEASRS